MRWFFLSALLIQLWACSDSGIERPENQENTYTKSVNFRLNGITLSHPPGFYSDTIELEIKSEYDVFYTLNGLKPVPGTSYTYKYEKPIIIGNRSLLENSISMIPTTPIPFDTYKEWEEPDGKIRKCTNLIIQAYHYDKPIGNAERLSYFIIPQDERTYTVPVLSLITDSVILFDKNKGLMVPGKRFKEDNPDWSGNYFKNKKIEGHLELFAEGELSYSENIKFKIHGSRTTAAPQKSLRFYTQPNDAFPFKFDHSETILLDRFVLRTPMADWHNRYFANAVVSDIAQKMGLTLTKGYPVVLYLNKEYWGIYFLRERVDEYMINHYSNCHHSSVNISESFINTKEGTAQKLIEITEFVSSQSLLIDSNFFKLQGLINILDLIDYYILHIHFSNDDWPHNNYVMWSCDTSKWKFVTVDNDATFRLTEIDFIDRLLNPDSTLENRPAVVLFQSLMQRNDFRKAFSERYLELLEGTLSPNSIIQVIEKYESILDPEIQEQAYRWNSPSSKRHWKKMNEIMKDFAIERPEYVLEHLKQLETYEY